MYESVTVNLTCQQPFKEEPGPIFTWYINGSVVQSSGNLYFNVYQPQTSNAEGAKLMSSSIGITALLRHSGTMVSCKVVDNVVDRTEKWTLVVGKH